MAGGLPRQDKELPEDEQSPCGCSPDLFSALPPELRPKSMSTMSSLRKVTCPGCGLVLWSNRSTDYCMDCEKRGVHRSPQELPREE